MFSGYRGDISATAAAFAPGGWFRTGDLASLGARGYLTIVDRRTDMVRQTELLADRASHSLLASLKRIRLS